LPKPKVVGKGMYWSQQRKSCLFISGIDQYFTL
jgi:hypothetical protein